MASPYLNSDDKRFELDPEVIPNVDDLVIEDGKPVDSIFAEKQYRLLTEPLHSSWAGPENGGTFLALSDVGLFYAAGEPALAPDVMLSLNVRKPLDLTRKDNRSYFVWIMGKPPDVVIEIVSDCRGSEEDYKMDVYARVRVTYYVIFDPLNRLSSETLRGYALHEGVYRPIDVSRLPEVGLGLTLWEGNYEDQPGRWLRWCDRDGVLIPTGHEQAKQERQHAEQERQRAEQADQRAEQERQRAEQADQRAEQERQRAERLVAQLRALGIEPNP
jgi:Uma2 family endonuclease